MAVIGKIVAGSLLLGLGAAVGATPPQRSTFITLGTNSGPTPNARRFEPANLLRYGQEAVLVDAGEGADQQMMRAGFKLDQVSTVVISHLHFDHTAGLFALIAQRNQSLTPGILTIYGPLGTKATVDAFIAAMLPATGRSGRQIRDPAATVHVIEIVDGAKFTIGRIAVTAASNSHYSREPEGSGLVSLSFRFDMPDRAIVYTGDTGPSENVEKLAMGADMLVAEITDPNIAVKEFRRAHTNFPPDLAQRMEDHFRREHLAPDEAGLMAAHSGVKTLVLTHNPLPDAALGSVQRRIAAHFSGKIAFAQDLERF